MDILFADNSTLLDLQFYQKNSHNEEGIMQIFKGALSTGGLNKIEEMVFQPTNDTNDIEQRQKVIRYLASHNLLKNFNSEDIEYLEGYSMSTHPKIHSYSKLTWYVKAFLYKIINPNQYHYVSIGVVKALRFLHAFADEISGQPKQISGYLSRLFSNVHEILENPFFKGLIEIDSSNLSFFKTLKIDYQLRKKHKDELKELLNQFYHLDAFTTIGKMGRNRGFCYPIFENQPKPKLILKGFFHPLVDKPIVNDFDIRDNNTVFLTGPNMSGKTTLLKSIGLCAYFAHLGFPVPCSQMRLTPIKSIITNIENVDNINLGYSFFYNEVRRVKTAVRRIKSYDNILWIADELFRGTNIKDAYDATKVIVEKITRTNGIKIISSHIMELTEELKQMNNITFKQMSSEIIDDLPNFTYTLEDGVSEVRLGMYFLRKEGIIEDLDSMINEVSQ